MASTTGFIGLVDERRGMEDFAETKAVEIEWKTSNATDFDSYAKESWKSYQYRDGSFIGPEQYIYHVR